MASHDARADAAESWSALGAAIGGAWDDARTLAQQHATLATREAAARTSGVGVDVALLLVAALSLQAALFALLAALGLALHQAGVAPWLAAIGVALLAAVVALATALAGQKRFRQRTRPPSQTLMALRETGAWLNDTVGRLGR